MARDLKIELILNWDTLESGQPKSWRIRQYCRVHDDGVNPVSDGDTSHEPLIPPTVQTWLDGLVSTAKTEHNAL